MASSSPASDFSTALLEEFVALGVRDIVVCPGSRSQALALAAASLERAGLLRLRVRVDERSAGFLALGLAVETKAPVLVVVTSGTAVANLHPAVLEAWHSAVPVVVLAADRPEELRGIASNQTTRQPGIFGPLIESIDVPAPDASTSPASAAALARAVVTASSAGPVHVNLQFREPLSGPVTPRSVPLGTDRESEPAQFDGSWSSRSADDARSVPLGTDRTRDLANSDGSIASLAPRPGTVVVAGAGAGPDAEATAHALVAPLIAEVSSGARFGPNVVVDYRRLLDTANFGDRVDRVIVYGHPTLSRQVPALVKRDGVELIVVRSGGEDWNPTRSATVVDAIEVDGASDDPALRSWLGRWVQASREALAIDDSAKVAAAISDAPADMARFNRDVLAGLRAPVTRRSLTEAVWRFTWPHDRLVIAASRLIREADQVVPGKKIPVHANRGLAGIDGTIATATGIALASQAKEGSSAAGITRVLLGDLAFLHDVGSLAQIVGEPRPRMQLIVGDDGGGTIFDSLEVRGTADAAAFDRVMLTSTEVDIRALAAGFGWDYVHAADAGALEDALAPTLSPRIIHVPLHR